MNNGCQAIAAGLVFSFFLFQAYPVLMTSAGLVDTKETAQASYVREIIDDLRKSNNDDAFIALDLHGRGFEFALAAIRVLDIDTSIPDRKGVFDSLVKRTARAVGWREMVQIYEAGGIAAVCCVSLEVQPLAFSVAWALVPLQQLPDFLHRRLDPLPRGTWSSVWGELTRVVRLLAGKVESQDKEDRALGLALSREEWSARCHALAEFMLKDRFAKLADLSSYELAVFDLVATKAQWEWLVRNVTDPAELFEALPSIRSRSLDIGGPDDFPTALMAHLHARGIGWQRRVTVRHWELYVCVGSVLSQTPLLAWSGSFSLSLSPALRSQRPDEHPLQGGVRGRDRNRMAGRQGEMGMAAYRVQAAAAAGHAL
jgi:hypothetical protein